MKTLHKIFIIIIILIICIGIYLLIKSRQHFSLNDNDNKKLINKLKKLKAIDDKKIKAKINDTELKNNLKNKNENYLPLKENFGDNGYDDDYLNDKIMGSPLGFSYYLPKKNILNPSEFTKFTGFNILKENTLINNENKELVNIKTISIDNPAIEKPSTLTNELDAEITSLQSSEKIEEKISKSISGNVGGAYSGVSVQASFAYVTNSTTKTEKNHQANNISFRKKSGSFGLKSEFLLAEHVYNQRFLLEVYNLKDKNVDDTYDLAYILKFFEKYGSHVIVSADLGKKVNLWDTVEVDKTTSENMLSVRACISISYGGWVTCVPNCDADGKNCINPCGEGKYCAGYEPAKDGDVEKKGTCQPEGKAGPGFSIGGEVCTSYKDETKKEATKIESQTSLIVSGGSSDSQAGLLISKINNVPNLDNTAVSNFLTSSSNYDVIVDLQFKAIWDILEDVFTDEVCEDNDINKYNYKLNDIKPGCKIIIADDAKNANFINDIKNTCKEILKNEYTTVIYTETKYRNIFIPLNIQIKTIDNRITFNLLTEGDKNYDNKYNSFDITELVPKIILRDSEAISSDMEEIDNLLKKIKLIIRYDKTDLKKVKLDYINPQNNFIIKNINSPDCVDNYIKDYDYSTELNLQISIDFDNFNDDYEYVSVNELKLNDNILQYKSSCDYNQAYILPTKSANRIQKTIVDLGVTYYTFYHYDDEKKINYIRLYVTETDFSAIFNHCLMRKSIENLKKAYIYDYVCPQFKVTSTATNSGTLGKGSTSTAIKGYWDDVTPEAGSLLCDKGFITKIESMHGSIVDNLKITCSNGDIKGPFGGRSGDVYGSAQSTNGFRAIASKYGGILDNISFYNNNYENQGTIGGNGGDTYSGYYSCPEGQSLVGFNLEKAGKWQGIYKIEGICRKEPPCVDIGNGKKVCCNI